MSGILRSFIAVVMFLFALNTLRAQEIKWIAAPHKGLVFQISNREAQRLLTLSKPDTIFKGLLHTVVDTFDVEKGWTNRPPKGHFILTAVQENKLHCEYTSVFPYQVFLLKEYNALSLQVLDLEGNVREDAKVKFKLRRIRLDPESRTYRLENAWFNSEQAIVTVELDGFRSVFNVERHDVPSWYDDDHDEGPSFYSYMITDKNRYKPGDQVRFKSYALSQSRSPIRRDLELWLIRPDRSVRVAHVSPHRPGSFAGEFFLHDSLKLVLDRKYQLQLRERKGRVVAMCSFRYEDYELHDNRLEVRLAEDKQFHPSPNQVSIQATDVNGLILKDASATVVVKTVAIRETFQPLASLSDTLMVRQVALDPDGPTLIDIPSSLFQKTNTVYEVIVSVLNSENRLMEQRLSSIHYFNQYEITTHFSNDSVIYKLRNNDVVMYDVPGRLQHDAASAPLNVVLPYKEKINPAVRTVSVQTQTASREIVMQDMVPYLGVKGGIERDSFNVVLDNPHKLSVSWYIYQGGNLLEKGFGEQLEYRSLITDRTQTYYVEMLYSFGGADHVRRSEYHFREDYLNVSIDIPERVYPGQKVNATIHVLDQLGRPVSNVDLTALATTARLGYYLPDLPYYGSTSSPRSKRAHYSKQDINKRSATLPLDYQKWANWLKLDTMTYYRYAYPTGMFSHTVPIDDSTQFAVFVMKDGAAKEVYVVELDKKPVFYSWVAQPSEYSFYVSPGTPHEISLRLYDRVLVFDSVTFQKGKKTILSVDLDKLPDNVSTHMLYSPPKKRRHGRITYPSFTATERARHIQYVCSFERMDEASYLESGLEFTPIASLQYPAQHPVVVGPITPGRQTFYNTWTSLETSYTHAGGYHYSFEDNIVYKLHPATLIPPTLEDKFFRPIARLNDLAMTKKRFLQHRPDPVRIWNTRVIDLVDHASRVSLLLPPDKHQSGIGAVLFQECGSDKVVSPCRTGSFNQDESFTIPRGCYHAIVVYNNGTYLRMDSIALRLFTKTVVDLASVPLQAADSLSWKWLTVPSGDCYGAVSKPSRAFQLQYSNAGHGNVRGNIYDEANNPLPGCNIVEKGTTNGTVTDVDGYFSLGISQRIVTLVVSFVGYATQEIDVRAGSDVAVTMQPDIHNLSEVVVVGYGVAKSSSLAYAIRGKVSGLQTSSPDISEEETVHEEADTFDEDVAQYDAENRLYQELMLLGGIRSKFSDVGFWEPRLFTDGDGESRFTVTFPDDITRWDATVYAMSRRLQTGTARQSIRSYKPVMAQLHVPRFLTRGDSAFFLGKVLNYTHDQKIDGKIEWGAPASRRENSIVFGSFHSDLLPVYAATTDSITTRYVFTRDDGYVDGEERTVPVVDQGVVRAEGSLTILNGNEEVRVRAADNQHVTVEVLSNPLDVYAGEVRYLLNYRYDCNEQLASKLQGLVNYKMLMAYEGKPFKYDRDVKKIIARLLNNQNEEFLWSWWDVSPNTSYWMSAHILRALQSARAAGYDVDLDVENIARKASYKFDFLNDYNLSGIDLLNALAAWNAKLDYRKHTYAFDSVLREAEAAYKKRNAFYRRYSLLKEKMLLHEVRQVMNIAYQRDSLLKYRKESITGELYFADSKPARSWYNNDLMVNSIAYRIVRRDSVLSNMLAPMQMYFLNTRRNGEWNTYHTSNVLMSVFPDLLATGASNRQPSTIVTTGKLNQTLSAFPFRADLAPGEHLVMRKTGGLPLYFMQYVKERVTEEKTGVEGFDIRTSIGKGDMILEEGKPITLTIEVDVSKDASAEHVMIEVPIPASCSYADKRKPYNGIETHREYFQDRTVIFCERMNAGKHLFDIPLLPRFTGRYLVNPAQISLMYVPVVNANTGMKVVKVK